MKLADFSNKRIFLTGHTGFKGTWFIHLLAKLGAEVKGYALPAENKSLFELTSAANFCQSFIGDIRNKQLLKKEILNFQPDFVFHFAAQPLVLNSYKDPVSTFEVNHLGTIYLLEAIKDLEKPCIVVIITTDKVYENKESIYSYRESDPLGGYDPYSASKAATEIAISSYRNSFFNTEKYYSHLKSLAVGRAGNVIGGGDLAENRIIPDVISSLKTGNQIELRNPRAVRPWQHVLDALFAYLVLASRLAEKPDDVMINGAWNFGPSIEDNFSVEDLTKLAIKFWGEGSYICKEPTKNVEKETTYLSLDTTKAKHHLGWKPKWDAETALHKTVSWYQQVLQKNYSPFKMTCQQIEEFLSL